MTEQLQAERSLGKKQTLELNQYELQLQELRNQLKEKEVTITELEKEKLFNAQIVDKIQHYEARFQNSSALQQELLNAQVIRSSILSVNNGK